MHQHIVTELWNNEITFGLKLLSNIVWGHLIRHHKHKHSKDGNSTSGITDLEENSNFIETCNETENSDDEEKCSSHVISVMKSPANVIDDNSWGIVIVKVD